MEPSIQKIPPGKLPARLKKMYQGKKEMKCPAKDDLNVFLDGVPVKKEMGA
jgi:hypothetical protein